MPDWQFVVVLILIAGSAGFLAMRFARFIKARNKGESACGSACHGCQQPVPSTTVVALDVPKTAQHPK